MDDVDERIPGLALPAGFEKNEWKPLGYQVRGIDWLLRPSAALFLVPGLGKTSITLAAFCQLRKMGLAMRMLVLAPLKVCQTTWREEVLKWAQFNHLKVGLAHGPNKQQVLDDLSFDIVCLNYDGVSWAVPHMQNGHNFDVLVCDELTRLKNIASKRYKMLKPLLKTFTFRWGLTGTPVANGLEDLFGQIYVLDLGIRFGAFITHYRKKYFEHDPYNPFKMALRVGAQDLILDKIKDLAMFVDPAEWLELPEFKVVTRKVQMPAELRPTYLVLADDYIFKSETQTIVAVNAGVLTSKLRQFTSGAIYAEDGTYEVLHDVKLEALEDLVEELAGDPLLVAYQFNHELERILERFPNALVLKGGMSEKATRAVMEKWNTRQYPLLLVQPAAASMGLNLQKGGSNICWFSLTYNLEDFIQLNKRLYRQGQERRVMCYILAMSGTHDSRVARVLEIKDVTQEMVFAALKL